MESSRNVVWALSNLCRTRSSSSFQWNKFAPIVGVIESLLTSAVFMVDEELVAESCWTLAYMMDGNANWSPVQAVIDAGLVQPLINLLDTETRPTPHRVLAAAVRAIGNIVTGTAEQTQVRKFCSFFLF